MSVIDYKLSRSLSKTTVCSDFAIRRTPLFKKKTVKLIVPSFQYQCGDVDILISLRIFESCLKVS